MSTKAPVMIAAQDVREGQRIYFHGITDAVTGVEQNDDGTAVVKFYDGRTATGGFFALVTPTHGDRFELTAGLA